MDAITFPPAPTNEPNLTYAPGSPERAELVAELDRQKRKQVSLRAVIGGRRRNGGGEEIKVVQPHDQQHVLGTLKNSTASDPEAAVKAAAKGATRWPAQMVDGRCSILHKAAYLVGGPCAQGGNEPHKHGAMKAPIQRARHTT